MPTKTQIHVELSEEVTAWLNEWVERELFNTKTDIVLSALQLMRSKILEDDHKQEELKKRIIVPQSKQF